MQAKLSTLWIFVLFNSLFRDVHELFRPGVLKQMQSGVVNGTEITESLMLVGGLIVEIPILMVVLSRFLPFKLNKWMNISSAVLMGLVTLQSGAYDLDDIFFKVIVLGALIVIIWQSWRWNEIKVGNGA